MNKQSQIPCQCVISHQHASYYGPKHKLSPCRQPAVTRVEVNGTTLLLCAKHAADIAALRFVPLGA